MVRVVLTEMYLREEMTSADPDTGRRVTRHPSFASSGIEEGNPWCDLILDLLVKGQRLLSAEVIPADVLLLPPYYNRGD